MLNKKIIKQAFLELDKLLPEKTNILIGGGAALLILDIMPIATMDIDAIPFKSVIGSDELKPYREKVAKKLGLPHDWINEHFYQFTFCLPEDYGKRLKVFFKGKKLICYVLHPTDIVIMKLFAHRAKDESHVKYLIKNDSTDLEYIDEHLEECIDKNLPKAKEAQNYFHDLLRALGKI